ncbi:hypothetical protein pipiens_011429 [Culex pipiens pipiens]|uniref:Uncharacterized protein n=1 Tax=Culex pipiens pipiens TaxID=38569 RepID=A0ABD1D6F9_CULPP
MESYLAKVLCYLINMRYDSDPRTMEELDRRGEPFVVLTLEKAILEGYHGLNIVEVKQKQVWHYRHYSTIAYCKIAEYLGHSAVNFDPETNDKLVTVLNERLTIYPAFYPFAGGHPLRSRFRLVLERMFDAGIWAKIYNKWTSEEQQFEFETVQVVSYRVNFPLEMKTFSQNSVRECSLILIEASHITLDLSNLPCFKTSSIFLILHETFNGSREAIHRTEQILRSIGAFKTFHIVSDPLSIVTFDIFGNMLANLPALVFSDRFFDLSGYHYKVHYATMEPYSSVYDNEGIDISVAKVVVQHQNATVEFVKDLGNFEDMRSVLERYSAGSVDFQYCQDPVIRENV